MTLVVNLYAGPGTGKSTTAAGVFALLKQDGINAELTHEFAKDLTWENRNMALEFQPYVITNQVWQIHKLLDQVDVVVNDSPILLGSIYRGKGFTKTFGQWLLEMHRSWRTLDIYLIRSAQRGYNPKGRGQSEVEAMIKDQEIWSLLKQSKVDFVEMPVKPGMTTMTRIHDLVLKELNAN